MVCLVSKPHDLSATLCQPLGCRLFVSEAGACWIIQPKGFEDSWESLDCKEIQPVHPKGNQSWVFIGRTDAEAETPRLWPRHVKSWLTGKDPDAGRDWGQEENGKTEDEMVGWHYRLDGYEFWVNSGSWWWTGRPGVLRFMGSQRVRHGWATELNWTERVWQKWTQESFNRVRGQLRSLNRSWNEVNHFLFRPARDAFCSHFLSLEYYVCK